MVAWRIFFAMCSSPFLSLYEDLLDVKDNLQGGQSIAKMARAFARTLVSKVAFSKALIEEAQNVYRIDISTHQFSRLIAFSSRTASSPVPRINLDPEKLTRGFAFKMHSLLQRKIEFDRPGT
jgi:hypothetical protein